jgi:hypothetical protein
VSKNGAPRYSGRVYRCAGCGGYYDELWMRQIKRKRSAGTIALCNGCWQDILAAVRDGKMNMGAELERLAAAAAGGSR